jgi:hypothetical protein
LSKELTLPYGITREEVDSVDATKLHDAMIKGAYLIEILLFSQAEHEALRISSTRQAIDKLFDDLYDESKLAGHHSETEYTTAQKVELLKLAHTMQNNQLKFMGDLHRNVTSGLDVVRTIQKTGNYKGPVETRPSQKKAMREMKRKIEDAMQERVKELEAKGNKK